MANNKIVVMGIKELERAANQPTKEVSKVRCVINVSDQPFYAFHQNIKIGEREVPYFWFPLIENAPFGFNSIGGAFKVYREFIGTGDVLIHCHAGINRSATVALLFKQVHHRGDIKAALKEIETYSNPVEMKAHNEEKRFLSEAMIPFLYELAESPTLGIAHSKSGINAEPWK